MSILSDLMAQFGGSGGQKNMGLLQRLAQGQPEYSSPIGPTMTGAAQGQINPAFNTSSSFDGSKLAELGNQLGAWGAGVSKASGPSATPVSFGQSLSGGQQGLQGYQDKQLENQLTQAKIVQAGQLDLDKAGQTALVKVNMGVELTPQEKAALKSYDTINQAKLTYPQNAAGEFVPQPAARSILPPNQAGAEQGGGQAPRSAPNLQDPGFQSFLKSKGLM